MLMIFDHVFKMIGENIMSRTYKFRNKDNTDNDYLKHQFRPDSFRGKNEKMDESEERSKLKMKNDLNGGENAPKWYRKSLNKKKKRKDKEILNKALKQYCEDDLSYPVWKNDANYYYF